jgi:outer membrane protein
MRAFLRATPVALLFLATLAGTASAQAAQKFAYVRSSVLLEQAPGRAEAEQQFDRETGTYSAEIKRMSDSLNTMIQAFEKTQATLSASARTARGQEIQAREASYQRRTQELQQKAQARQNELVQPILDRVKAGIEDVRVEGGYTFIFNIDGNSPIIAADKNLDITDRVIAKLRATGAARPAGTAPAAAPAGVTRPATPPND